MAELAVTIQMAEPFLVGGRKLGAVTETLSYVPGSVLRGVLAETVLRECGPETERIAHPEECKNPKECAFCRIFYPENGSLPRFGNLYPTSGDPAYPFPTTARTCKHHPGFLRDEPDPDERHGVFDTLIRQFAFEQALESGQPLPFLYLPTCPRCGYKADAMDKPFYSLAGRYQSASIYRRRLSRTAISRRRGAAEAEQLFTLEMLDQLMDTDFDIQQVTTLRGSLWLGDDGVQAMQTALRSIERIGAVRSRGLGRIAHVEVNPVEVVPDPQHTAHFLEQASSCVFRFPEHLQKCEETREPLCPQSLAERLIAFNARLQVEQTFYARLQKVQAQNAGSNASSPPRWYFTVNLLSDAILTDRGLPTLQLTPEMLELSESGLPQVKLERCFVGRTYRSGWSGAHGLPREVRLAVPMGGVYLYGVECASPEATGHVLEKLEHWEQEGLGLERERGFGQVMACLPFHLEWEAR